MLKSSILIFFMMSTSTNSMFQNVPRLIEIFFMSFDSVCCALQEKPAHFYTNSYSVEKIAFKAAHSASRRGAARPLAMYQDTRFTARGETF